MEKKVIVIAAVSQDGVFGVNNSIPWKISSEMKHFQDKTVNHTVVMGARTWESLPSKFRPLPRRTNIVITRNPDYNAPGAYIYRSIEGAIAGARTEKIFLIGGLDIWYHAMSLAEEAMITVVAQDFKKDGGERMAPDLLKPNEKWTHFTHHDQEHYALPGEIPYTIHYWSRSGQNNLRG